MWSHRSSFHIQSNIERVHLLYYCRLEKDFLCKELDFFTSIGEIWMIGIEHGESPGESKIYQHLLAWMYAIIFTI